jgi:hypothetical protein
MLTVRRRSNLVNAESKINLRRNGTSLKYRFEGAVNVCVKCVHETESVS